jgi:small subunit ribosomal protein S2
LETEREALSKREMLEIEREVSKMKSFYEGLRDMKKIPSAIWVVDVKREVNAVLEARALGVKVFGIADTNCDPDLLDYVVPGNDDAIRSVKLLTSIIADAVIEGSTYAAKKEVEETVVEETVVPSASEELIEEVEEIEDDLIKKI